MPLPTLQLAKLEQMALQEALDRTRTFEDAAVLLGISRHAIKRRIRKYALDLGSIPGDSGGEVEGAVRLAASAEPVSLNR